jgi:hypothetical protein
MRTRRIIDEARRRRPRIGERSVEYWIVLTHTGKRSPKEGGKAISQIQNGRLTTKLPAEMGINLKKIKGRWPSRLLMENEEYEKDAVENIVRTFDYVDSI